MPFDITFQSLPVLIDGHDTEGRLVLANGQLAAVLARLDGGHHSHEHSGKWNLEAGFGKCADNHAPVFDTPEEAGEWVRRKLDRG
jgi:hypothetical protein